MTTAADPNSTLLRRPWTLASQANWLIRLRWVAVVGQLSTVTLAVFVFDMPLALSSLTAVIGFTALTNVVFSWWIRQVSRRSPEASPRRTVWVLMAVMLVDLMALTALLYFAGGVNNPFSVFYLVNLTLCAVLLTERSGWLLTAAAALGMAFLTSAHVEFPELSENLTVGGNAASWTLGELGRVAAMATCGLVIIYFVSRVTRQLENTAAELQRVEREKSRSEKLEALGTLAGGAAHELATPLSTIAVVSKELMRHVQKLQLPDSVREDIRLIRSEVDHCQIILQRMTGRAGQWSDEQEVTTDLKSFLSHSVSELSAAARVDLELPSGGDRVLLRIPPETLAQAIRGLIQNGLDSTSGGRVRVSATWNTDRIRLEVRDDGPGMSNEVLERAGEPFFTTKEPGRGMGLGLFLTRSVVERLGGTLQVTSSAGRGVTATVELTRWHPSPTGTTPQGNS